MDKRPVPAAQKQSGREHRNREHVHVFGQEEEGKLHRAVLGMKSSDQLGLGFRQIERYAIRFSDGGDQIDQKTEWLYPEHVPTADPQMAGLLFDYAVEVKRAGLQNYSDQPEP